MSPWPGNNVGSIEWSLTIKRFTGAIFRRRGCIAIAQRLVSGVPKAPIPVHTRLQGDQHARTTLRLGHTSPRSLRPYCGVYDPAQAKIEALSVVKTAQKYHESDDAVFQDRCIFIKEQRAEECKHHLMVLWADFFAPAHFDEFLSCTTCSGRPFIKRVRQRNQWIPQLASSSCRTSMRLPTFSGRRQGSADGCVPASVTPIHLDDELNLGAWLRCQAPFFFHAGGGESGVRSVFKGERRQAYFMARPQG